MKPLKLAEFWALAPTPAEATHPRFAIGQQVCCAKGQKLWIVDHPDPLRTQVPAQGSACTITDMEYWPQFDDWYLQFAEYPATCAYVQGNFVAEPTTTTTQVTDG